MAIIPLFGVGMALGNIFSTSIATVGRNPACRDKVFPMTILSFALTEAIALFALLIAFLILFV
jgi:F-type H+-transporting ATPase subunit c